MESVAARSLITSWSAEQSRASTSTDACRYAAAVANGFFDRSSMRYSTVRASLRFGAAWRDNPKRRK
jgi:hypothetical protein